MSLVVLSDLRGDARLRVGLHLTLAALPLLAISAHVFGLLPMHLSAGLVVVPLAITVLLLALFAPVGEERVIGSGMLWGAVATLVYDLVRLDTVYLLGWWGDFIPTVGTWILHTDPDAVAGGAVVGYLWRYAGDGGGIGVTFFVLAAATGLHRRGARVTVAAAVAFAVFPVWAGLIATVALAPRGQQLMFPLTPVTIALSLLGHVVFGLVLGLGCTRCRDLERHWRWAPLLDLLDLGVLGPARAARPRWSRPPDGPDPVAGWEWPEWHEPLYRAARSAPPLAHPGSPGSARDPVVGTVRAQDPDRTAVHAVASRTSQATGGGRPRVARPDASAGPVPDLGRGTASPRWWDGTTSPPWWGDGGSRASWTGAPLRAPTRGGRRGSSRPVRPPIPAPRSAPSWPGHQRAAALGAPISPASVRNVGGGWEGR